MTFFDFSRPKIVENFLPPENNSPVLGRKAHMLATSFLSCLHPQEGSTHRNYLAAIYDVGPSGLANAGAVFGAVDGSEITSGGWQFSPFFTRFLYIPGGDRRISEPSIVLPSFKPSFKIVGKFMDVLKLQNLSCKIGSSARTCRVA